MAVDINRVPNTSWLVTLVADPTLAPGAAYPPGTVGFFGGTYYEKWGTGDTEWSEMGMGSSVLDRFTVVGADVETARVVKCSADRTAAKAQADTAANAAVIGVSTTASTLPGINTVFAVRYGNAWVKCDRSGAHPAPVVGNIIYLSTDTAGLGQADVPAVAATDQRLRLGRCVGVDGVDPDLALVNLSIEMFPVTADGTA